MIEQEKVKGPLRRSQLPHRDAFSDIICNYSYSQIIENCGLDISLHYLHYKISFIVSSI